MRFASEYLAWPIQYAQFNIYIPTPFNAYAAYPLEDEKEKKNYKSQGLFVLSGTYPAYLRPGSIDIDQYN